MKMDDGKMKEYENIIKFSRLFFPLNYIFVYISLRFCTLSCLQTSKNLQNETVQEDKEQETQPCVKWRDLIS